MNKLLALARKQIRVFIRNIRYPEQLTLYPDAPRKGRARILWDHVLWALRFGRAHDFYYLLGFDRKQYAGYRQKNISARASQKIIQRKKISFHPAAPRYDMVIMDKFVAGQYLESLGFPVPRTLAVVYGDTLLLPQEGRELPVDTLWNDGQNRFSECICKPVTGGQGKGVFLLQIREGKVLINQKERSRDELRAVFAQTRFLLQERVVQHERMAALNPHAINTLRLTTLIHDGRPIPFTALTRIGVQGSVTDNWHTGGVMIRVNVDTGRLDAYGYVQPDAGLTHGGKRYGAHPETGVRFEGFEIPFYREAVEMATNLHKYFYALHSMGWDIAITPTGPVFIEGNQFWGPPLIEDDFIDKLKTYFM